MALLLRRPPTALRCRHSLRFEATPRARFSARTAAPSRRATATVTVTALTSLALLGSFESRPVHCDAGPSERRPYATPRKRGLELDETGRVESTVSVSHLSFGTATGFCAGVFVKKGLTFVAFILGGAFVFLQYLHSRGLVNIKWSGFQRNYDRMIQRRTEGQKGDSTLAKLSSAAFDFLTDDFQGRGMFAAGFVLGFRMG